MQVRGLYFAPFLWFESESQQVLASLVPLCITTNSFIPKSGRICFHFNRAYLTTVVVFTVYSNYRLVSDGPKKF
jgi:hypothetical protein